MVKKISVFILCIVMANAAMACQNIGSALGEKFVETILGKHTEIKGDLVTVTHSDGMKYFYSNGKWPEIPIVKLVPKLKTGTVDRTVYTKSSCVIIIKGVSESCFNDYIKSARAVGYAHVTGRSAGDNELDFSAENNVGSELRVSFFSDSEMLIITLFLNNEMKCLTND